MTSPESLKSRVLEAARAHPVPRRSERRLPAALLTTLAAAAMVGVLLAAGGPAHAAGRPASLTAWILAGTIALAVAATWLALPARRSMLPRPRGQLLAVVAGVPLLLGLMLACCHPGYPDPFERLGARCFALTLATAPWPFLVLAYLGRRSDPVHPGFTGAALGAAAGAWAAVMVELWCPLAAPDHVLAGHALPLVALAAAGAALGRRLFRLAPAPAAP